MVNGEYKGFDLVCNETHDSQEYTRVEGKSICVIEECKEFESLVIKRMIQNYEYEWRERNLRLKITYMMKGTVIFARKYDSYSFVGC